MPSSFWQRRPGKIVMELRISPKIRRKFVIWEIKNRNPKSDTEKTNFLRKKFRKIPGFDWLYIQAIKLEQLSRSWVRLKKLRLKWQSSGERKRSTSTTEWVTSMRRREKKDIGKSRVFLTDSGLASLPSVLKLSSEKEVSNSCFVLIEGQIEKSMNDESAIFIFIFHLKNIVIQFMFYLYF